MSKFLIDGVWVDAATGKPVAESKGGEQGDLRAKLDAAERKAAGLEENLSHLRGVQEKTADQRDDLQRQLQKVKAEYADFVQASDKTGKQYQQERDGLQTQVDMLAKERDDLQAKLDAVKALPDNALELLESVKGIGADTAKKALDTLTSGKPSDGK